MHTSCIHKLLLRAYDQYKCDAAAEADVLSFGNWCAVRAKECVQFDYWQRILSLEIIMLLYVRAICEGSFELYVELLRKIVPWMFALDHTHYSRWLPVHIRDMMLLSEKHPAVLAEFCACKFAVYKTSKKFSAMAIDQCHKQNNAVIKESGGEVGLTNNLDALRRWMVAGPEVPRMVEEFDYCILEEHRGDINHHHYEQHLGVTLTIIMNSI